MRERILARVREASRKLPDCGHPGPLEALPLPGEAALALFAERFTQAGGQVALFDDLGEARLWLREFQKGFGSAAVGRLVPEELRPGLPQAPPEEAPLGVSLARCAAAETGSLLLDARDGRRVQLLPQTHLIWVRKGQVVAGLGEALLMASPDLPSCLALHSGPSKSADIGQIVVTGVHGPGRVIAAVIP